MSISLKQICAKTAKLLRKIVASLFAAAMFLCASCAVLTPAPVPPLTKDLGFHIPNYKGITTTGLISATVKVETARLSALSTSAALTIEAVETARKGFMDYAMAGGFAAMGLSPLAARKIYDAGKKKAQA